MADFRANLAGTLSAIRARVEDSASVTTDVGHSSEEAAARAAARYASGLGGEVFHPRSQTGHVGLVNQGATCYLNSLIQALFMLPSFRGAVLDWRYDPERHGVEEQCVARQLQKLFAQLQLSSRGAVQTGGLTKSFGWHGSEAFAQQDVQECKSVIFEHLSQHCAGSCLGEYLSSEHRGELTHVLTCRSCGASRSRLEPFTDLQLPIAGKSNVRECLEGLLQRDAREGVDCPSCGVRGPHWSAPRFSRLPSVLVLQLHRFSMNWSTMTRVKVHQCVSIEEDLAVPLSGGPQAEQDPCNGCVEAEGDSHDGGGDSCNGGGPPAGYALLSVLMHTGSAHSGHYFCYTRDAGTSQWLHFNDAKVEALGAEGVRSAFRPGGAAPSREAVPPAPRNAYMLVYVREGALGSFPGAERVPGDLRAAIALSNAAYEERRARHLEER